MDELTQANTQDPWAQAASEPGLASEPPGIARRIGPCRVTDRPARRERRRVKLSVEECGPPLQLSLARPDEQEGDLSLLVDAEQRGALPLEAEGDAGNGPELP